MDNKQRYQLVSEIFSPSAPIENESLFIGRQSELHKIKDAIEERGQHIVMYGGRGVGKTSLANMVCSIFENVVTSKVTCYKDDNFFSVWEKALKRIKFTVQEKTIGYNNTTENTTVPLFLPQRDFLEPADIEEVFNTIKENVLIILDEFDSVEDEDFKKLMAATLKIFSDNVPNITVMIVGIAESVNKLLGVHPSLERCIKQIDIPLMNTEESIDMISNSMNILKMEMDDETTHKIVEYASGFPHYIHLLCKFSTLSSLERKSIKICKDDLNFAVEKSIENSDQSLRSNYSVAVSSAKYKNQFEDVILASCLAETDEHSSFSPDDVLQKFNELTQKELKKESIVYNLGMLCKSERGDILTKHGNPVEKRFKFKNPLMKAFVKLKMHKKES